MEPNLRSKTGANRTVADTIARSGGDGQGTPIVGTAARGRSDPLVGWRGAPSVEGVRNSLDFVQTSSLGLCGLGGFISGQAWPHPTQSESSTS
jgi:hypothetical protein